MPQIYSKSLAEITDTGDDFDYGPNGGFTAILSTPSLDRDGDRLGRSEWVEPFQKRYPLDIDHGMTVADTVGSFEPFFEDDTLKMRAFFASTDKAQEVRTLVDEKHIGAVSVAFMNDKTAKKDGNPHRELLNAGIVAIPSNRDAIILASKAYDAIESVQKQIDEGIMTPEELHEALGVKSAEDVEPESVTDDRTAAEVISDLFNFDGTKSAAPTGNDTALLQAIHDASVHLGAQCVACTEPHAADMPQGSMDAQDMPKSVEEDAVEAKTFDEAFDEVIKTATVEVDQPEDDSADEVETAADAAVSVEKAAESEAIRKSNEIKTRILIDLLSQ